MSGRRSSAARRSSLYTVELAGARFVVLSMPGALAGADALSKLTATERKVAELAVQGLPDAEIARRRGVTRRTVANQLASVFRKLQVGSRFELAARLGSRAQRPHAAR